MDNVMEMNYQERKERIRGELNQVAESFVEIGYQLKQINAKELYREDGYTNIHEFAKNEYNSSQTSTSRFMAINSCFSIDGNSPKLIPEYEGYGYSKLSEMLTLTEEEMKLVSICTTRAEIRDLKQMKKEAESSQNNEIYAPAHNQQSPENTQLEGGFSEEKSTAFPNGISLMIELFRDRSRRETLKQLSALLLNGTSKGSISEAAAEIINPSGHMMFRKGLIVMMFEENHIKYNKFGTPVQQFTYMDLLDDITVAFAYAAEDPWVEFYGEPEPEPEPPKEEPKTKSTPQVEQKKKDTKKPVSKPASKPEITQPEDDFEDDQDEDEGDTAAGEEELSDQDDEDTEGSNVRKCRVCGCTDDHACEGGCYWVEEDLCSACAEKQGTCESCKHNLEDSDGYFMEHPDTDELPSCAGQSKWEPKTESYNTEILEADIVQTAQCQYCGKEKAPILSFRERTVSINQGYLVMGDDEGIEAEKKINYCPMCGCQLEPKNEN